MTKEERKMIGTLMEMGFPTSQLKSAVGRHVTPKDLQNAKTHIKAVKMGLKSDEPKVCPRRRKTYREMQMARAEARRAAGLSVSNSDEEEDNAEKSSSSFHNSDEGDTVKNQEGEEVKSSGDVDSRSFTVTIEDIEDHLEVVPDSLEGDIKYAGSVGNMDGLSGLLAAAGLSSDSVVLRVNNQNPGKDVDEADNNSYTVTVSLPEGEVTHSVTNLQELLKGLPLGKIITKSSSPPPSSPTKIKSEENESLPETKECVKCGGYISPLDGHSQCLSCLGPDHIHEHNCDHCKAMTPEQFNIRRKKMVAMRMKALKDMRRKRKQGEHSDEYADSDTDFSLGVRKSKRIRKPKNYGPDMEVENSFVLGGRSSAKTSRDENNFPNFKTALSEDGDKFSAIMPKTEVMDDDDLSLSNDYTCDSKVDSKVTGWNTKRFDHILSQATIFDDVVLAEGSNKSSSYLPEIPIFSEFQKLVDKPDTPAAPPTLLHKYMLHPKFESSFCADSEPLTGTTDSSVEIMSTGLCKLVKNAVVQTRVAVYDKLFTRLGVSMADEALSILSELYSKVTKVTEICQEDLTNSLQTALDTIQALKDVLEELGIMSKDALTTAAHQRSLSVNSLDSARKSLQAQRGPSGDASSRRGKFLPFSRAQIIQRPVPNEQTHNTPTPNSVTGMATLSASSYDQKHLTSVISSAHLDTHISDLPIMAITTAQDGLDVSSDATTATFINMSGKEFTMAPLAVSSELLQSLTTTKDGIIELHVLKDETELLDTEDSSTVEEVIQSQ